METDSTASTSLGRSPDELVQGSDGVGGSPEDPAKDIRSVGCALAVPDGQKLRCWGDNTLNVGGQITEGYLAATLTPGVEKPQ